MLRGFGRVLDRATLAGSVMAIASSVISAIVIAATPLWRFQPIPSAILGSVVGLVTARLLLPTPMLRAFEAFSWLGRSEMDRFERRTGGKVPVPRPEQERWLDEHPPNGTARLERIEILAFLGRLDEARAELEEVVATGPDQAFERASLLQYVGWLSDGEARLDAFRAAVADLALDSHHRRAADVNIALGDARERFMRTDTDWSRPLREVRPGLGRAPTVVVLRDTWRQLAIVYLLLALVAGAITPLLLALA